MSRGSEPRPQSGSFPIDQGVAQLLRDPDSADAWLLLLNGVPSSFVDLADPTRLDFEYMVWIAAAVAAFRPNDAIDVVHLGGAGCTLARWAMATRPGSRHIVFEPDAALLDLVREMFGLRSSRRLRLRPADALTGLATLAPASVDVVIRDAFADGLVPDSLTSVAYLGDVRRVLRPGGIYLANVADGPPLERARREVATAGSCFADVAFLTEPAVMRGRRRGNLVIVAGESGVPLDALRRRASAGAVPARLVEGERVRDFTAGALPIVGDRHVGAPTEVEANTSSSASE